MDSQLQDALRCEYENIGGIDSFNCILGLSFPDSATPFQMSFLTLAHLMASTRDYILKGHEIPVSIVTTIKLLTDIIVSSKDEQR